MVCSHLDKLIRKSPGQVHLLRGQDKDDRDCYYVVLCSPEKIKTMRNVQAGYFTVEDYGKIIASGFGAEPSAAVKAKVLEKYGYNLDEFK